jgi:hypothetical protein
MIIAYNNYLFLDTAVASCMLSTERVTFRSYTSHHSGLVSNLQLYHYITPGGKDVIPDLQTSLML